MTNQQNLYWFEEGMDHNGKRTGHYRVYSRLDDMGNKLLMCICYHPARAATIVKALNKLSEDVK